MALKIFLKCFYTHSLFLQTCLGPWVSPRANGMVVQPTIPFLLSQTQPNGHFLALIPILSLKSSKRECWWMGGLDLGRPRKFFGALPDMVIMFGDIPRSIAIFQSKREGHTTPQSHFRPQPRPSGDFLVSKVVGEQFGSKLTQNCTFGDDSWAFRKPQKIF